MRPSSSLPATLAAALALIEGGHMTFDSIYRFVFGDFIRIGGQLAPLTGIVSAFGVEPIWMGPIFPIFGIAYLCSAVALLAGHRSGRLFVTAMGIATLWYLISGTISSLIQLVLLRTDRPAKT